MDFSRWRAVPWYAYAVATRYRLFAIAAAIALAADQLSKLWARSTLVLGRPIAFVGGVWDWELSYNRGIAFGLFRTTAGATVFLSIIAVAACVAILLLLRRAADAHAVTTIGFGLVFAGALGNLIDRVSASQVTDFIVWRLGTHRWQNFNVADASLVVGVVALVLSPRSRRRSAARA